MGNINNITSLDRHIIFACIGPVMPEQTDPIYETGALFPPERIFLITSDEAALPGREPANKNAEYIREHYRKISAEVTIQYLKLENFEDNYIELASQIVLQYMINKDMPVIIDLSAGRGTIRQALSRGGEIAVDYIHKFHDPEFVITCTIRSWNRPVISYQIGKSLIPGKKDALLLDIVEQNLSQTTITQKLGWKNQSEVSKAMQRLIELDLLEKDGHHRNLTPKGKLVRKLFSRINKN